jgi:molybdate transport system substrate-binding protein
VFVTDAKAASAKLDSVAIPEAVNVTATYPIALLKTAAGNRNAQEFVAFVLSTEGRSVLSDFGFVAP